MGLTAPHERNGSDGMTLLMNHLDLPTRLGLGCASAWGQAWFDESKALAIVHRALDLGITVFDTGPSYSRGHAEPRLGKALKGVAVDNLLVSTKIGTHIGRNGKLFHDLSRTMILQSVEASRRQLNLDRIPLLYLHGPRLHELNSELEETLLDVQDRGWIGRVGVNSFDTAVLQAVVKFSWLDVVMLDYNVLRPGREPLIAQLTMSGKRVVAGAGLANHLFAPKFLRPTSAADVWYLARAFKNHRTDLFRARSLSQLMVCPGWSPTQVALAFVLSNKNVTAAMFGTTRMEHLEENALACRLHLPDAVVEQIRTVQEFETSNCASTS
jgi:aryl-alcohol dehydrogenase-like predicted oxidoreductase